MLKITLLPDDSFTWSRWRRGNPIDLFGCRIRESDVPVKILKKYVVGYRPAENLRCRPKAGHTAILILKNDDFSWFHIRNSEFSVLTKSEK